MNRCFFAWAVSFTRARFSRPSVLVQHGEIATTSRDAGNIALPWPSHQNAANDADISSDQHWSESMFRLRNLLVVGTLALAGLLGGCVYYPGYGSYGSGYYGGSYYGGP